MRATTRCVIWTLATLFLAMPAAFAQDDAQCMGGTADTKITACTAAIEAGRQHGSDLTWMLVNRGTGYHEKGDLERAIADYNEAIAINPAYAVAFNARGLAYRSKGDLDRAIADYTVAIGLSPGFALAYVNRGRALATKVDLDRAIADFDEAIRLAPDDADTYIDRGNAYADKHDPDRALADYTAAIERDPTSALAHYNRGIIYYHKADLDQAIADYDEAISLNPDYTDAYSNRGLAYREMGDLDRAIEDLNEAIRLAPNDASNYMRRGLAYHQKGDAGRAIADYDEAIRRDPRNAAAFGSRGQVRLGSDNAKALADLARATELDPKDPYYALWLDIAAHRAGKASRLPQAIENIDMTAWPAPVIRFYLGQLTADAALTTADDPDRVTTRAQLCEAHFYIGAFALRRNAKSEAAGLFQRAVDDCPKSFVEWSGAIAELKTLAPAPLTRPRSPHR